MADNAPTARAATAPGSDAADRDLAAVGPIVLVGMMATGKSSVARQLGRRLDRRVFDSDAMISARTGRTVAQLFESGGEPAFRGLETEVLEEALTEQPPGVVAAAGGVVLSEANRRRLRRVSADGGVVVWLRADPTVLAARVRPGDHRPLLARDPAGTLARLTGEREGLYAEVADRSVDTGRAPFARIVDQVMAAIGAVADERRKHER
jgi:shikimate kinase